MAKYRRSLFPSVFGAVPYIAERQNKAAAGHCIGDKKPPSAGFCPQREVILTVGFVL